MKKRIALFGGSFNPPGKHHRQIAEKLAQEFEEVVVVPCGPRPDKPALDDLEIHYRAAMVDLNFQRLDRVRVELFDLENLTFTRAFELDKQFAPQGEIWHVIGTDLVKGGAKGQSPIQTSWAHGEEFWNSARFAVVTRPGVTFERSDLPPQHKLIELKVEGSSSDIREFLFRRAEVRDKLTPEVADYIDRHGLYHGRPSTHYERFRLEKIRPMVVVDDANPEARSIGSTFSFPRHPDPNLILVVGGDGAMLRAIRKHWRLRLPFYGVNAGHMGFLLNEKVPPLNTPKLFSLHQLPLLWVKATTQGGSITDVAFNDAWVERATGQTAWIEVTVDGATRIARMYGDAALVSTAAGSTSYARAMGAQPLPFNTPALVLVGSNVLRPRGWRGAVLPLESCIRFRALDPIKRPLNGFLDGVPQGNVETMEIRLSRTASVELVFDANQNPAQKLAKIQFP